MIELTPVAIPLGKALEKGLEKGLDIAADVFKEKLKQRNEELKSHGEDKLEAQLRAQPDNVMGALRSHMKILHQWCTVVGFADLKQPRKLGDSFVPLQTYVMPVRTHQNKNERTNRISLDQALAEDGHCVLLGQPGAGKTTSLQKLVLDYFEGGKALRRFNYPILVRLRDLSASDNLNPIISAISQVLPLGIHFPSHKLNEKRALIDMPRANLMEVSYHALLDSLKIVLLLDGFDEIVRPELRETALSEIRRLTRNLSSTKVILTCRSGDYTFEIENTRKFELSPLTLKQVREFALKWLPPEDAGKFLDGIKTSPYGDTAMRPLSIAHLCALYQRTGRIPDKPKYVYRKITYLLLEDWDDQRSVRRLSKYAAFEPDRKIDFLSQFAFILTTQHRTFTFNSSTLHSAYSQICEQFGLPKEQASKVVKEIESHSGLVQEAYHSHFEFAHKSIQEYLAAEYIVKLPTLEVVAASLSTLPAEMAIAVAMSTDPALYFERLVLLYVTRMNASQSFAAGFASRLELEKPDMLLSEAGLIAASLLITLLPRERPLPKVLVNYFGASALKELKARYRFSGKNSEGEVNLVLYRAGSAYEFPETLTLPAKLFARV